MRTMRISGVVVAVALALTACGGSAEDPAATDPAPAGSSSGAAADAAGPVTVVPEEGAAVEAAIGPDGGSLVATAADGTTFTLTVPVGALPSDTTIRAVPATLDGLDVPTHTVMFEPSGLTFLDWATLAIVPAAEIPIENQFMYQLNDAGTEFGAAWVDPAQETPTILLDHFSGYGLANATEPERAAVLIRGAAEAEQRIQSKLAEVIGKERQAQLLGLEDGTTIGEIFEQYREEWENEVIKPRLEAAGASCEATQLALQTVLGYERQRQLLGVGSSSEMNGMEILTEALATNGGPCEKEAIEKCKAARDPGILISFWLGVERQRQLLGAGETGTFDVAQTIRKARSICAPVSYETFVEVPSIPTGITIEGTICSLTEPFTLPVRGDYKGKLRFTPSSDEGGDWSFKGRVFNAPLTAEGSGSYSVVMDENSVPQSIDFDFITTISIPTVGDQTGGGPVSMPLLALAACDAE